MAVVLAAGGSVISARSASGLITYNMTLTLSQHSVDLNNPPGSITATATLTYQGQPQTGLSVGFSSVGGDETFRGPSNTPSCPTNANGSCTVTLIPGTSVGAHTIKTTFSNPAGSGSATSPFCQYYTPASVSLSFQNGANRVAPNGESTTTANVLVHDGSGRGVPCQSQALSVTTDNTSTPVAIGNKTETGAQGNYQVTITGPTIPLSSPPTWSGSGIPAQNISATVGGATTSQALQIDYPKFHTVQFPQPNPGLYDEFNRPVRLTGVNGVFMASGIDDGQDTRTNGGAVYHMASPKFLPFDVPSDTQAGKTNTSWNSSIVRFQLTDLLWCATDAACDTPGPSHPELIGTCGDHYRQNLQAMINKVTELGMVAELSLSRVGALSQPPATALTCNSGDIDQPDQGLKKALRTMADYVYAPSFWQQIAAQNANNPLVGFDLYNEPNLRHGNSSCSASVPQSESPYGAWMNAGLAGTADENDTVIDGTGPYRAAGMQLMYNAVRSAAPNNLVFVAGSGQELDATGASKDCNENAAYDLSPVLNGYAIAGGNNVIYATHPYYGSTCANNASGVHDSTAGTDTIPGIPSGFPPNLQSAVFNTAAKYPVAFTEFGSFCRVDSEAANFTQGLVTDAENPANHIVAWSAFQFISKDMEGASGYMDPTQKSAAPYFLIQCTEDKPADCSANGHTYNWYEASQRGVPVYNTLIAEPPLK